MCFGSSKTNTKPPEPTPPTTFSYRAGADSLKQQQQGLAAAAAPPAYGSELGSSSKKDSSPFPKWSGLNLAANTIDHIF